jgi:phosphoribosylanthranilate isomerase
MWVKICGNTNLEDAAMAADFGADAVGFVFARSKRQVTPAQVAAITRHLPDRVERVGVFDSASPEEIAQAASVAGLTAVQLHGHLDEKLLEQLSRKLGGKMQLIQVLHWAVDEPVTRADASPSPSAAASKMRELERLAVLEPGRRVLIDSQAGAARGGTGVAYDWSLARQVFRSAPDNLKLIAAGGLKPDNIAAAIAELAPWGVDVSSGVEASPGRKDPVLVRLFIENAHGARTPDIKAPLPALR